jgi:hypothetical protein
MVAASLMRHVIIPLRADLALMCSSNCTGAAYHLLLPHASYAWTRTEPAAHETWSVLLSMQPHGRESMAIAARSADDRNAAWGLTIASDGRRRKGFGAAVLSTKAQLLERLQASGALQRYAWFVFTRPDIYHLCAHPSPREFDRDAITVPGPLCLREKGCRGKMAGPEYVNDRHAIVPRQHTRTYLSTLQMALNETHRRGRLWCGESPTFEGGRLGGTDSSTRDAQHACCCTSERQLGGHLNASGVRVHHVLLPLLLVRTPSHGPTSHHLSGSWLQDNRGRHDWGARADELPSGVLQDLQCLPIPLETEFAVAVEACAQLRGRAATAGWVATAFHILTKGEGTYSRGFRLATSPLGGYVVLVVLGCVWHGCLRQRSQRHG